jgi:S1-C subfamily serine protease
MNPVPQQPLAPDQLFQKVADSVVMIKLNEGVGSGFFVGNGSVVATNAHVVGYYRKVKVKMRQGEEFHCHVLRAFKEDDLAFVYLREKKGIVQPLRSSTTLRVGQTVMAIGNPLGLEYSLTRGIISGLNQVVLGRKLIQTDASISPGNSGGPLYDEFGSVIGVNSMVAGEGGKVSLAIPSDLLADRLKELMDAWATFSNTFYCTLCGHRTPDARYCQACGVDRKNYEKAEEDDEATRMEKAATAKRQAVSAAAKNCVTCKSLVQPGVKYCPKCGTSM